MPNIVFEKTLNRGILKFDSSHYMEVRKKHSKKDFISMDDLFNSSYHAGHHKGAGDRDQVSPSCLPAKNPASPRLQPPVGPV